MIEVGNIIKNLIPTEAVVVNKIQKIRNYVFAQIYRSKYEQKAVPR